MNNLRILLVDSNKSLLEILQATLMRDGHTVLIATDLNSALEVALHSQPDVIITDYNIPGGTGMLLSDRLYSHGFSGFRLVLLFEYSADFSEPLWDAVASGKVTGFLLKPFTKVELRAVLNYAASTITRKAEPVAQSTKQYNKYLQSFQPNFQALSF